MGGTETIIAAAARQFCERHTVWDAPSTFGEKRKTYDTICIPVPSVRPIHCGNIDMCAVYEPILGDKAAISSELLDNDKDKPVLTSVTMIPVIGPRKTV